MSVLWMLPLFKILSTNIHLMFVFVAEMAHVSYRKTSAQRIVLEGTIVVMPVVRARNRCECSLKVAA